MVRIKQFLFVCLFVVFQASGAAYAQFGSNDTILEVFRQIDRQWKLRSDEAHFKFGDVIHDPDEGVITILNLVLTPPPDKDGLMTIRTPKLVMKVDGNTVLFAEMQQVEWDFPSDNIVIKLDDIRLENMETANLLSLDLDGKSQAERDLALFQVLNVSAVTLTNTRLSDPAEGNITVSSIAVRNMRDGLIESLLLEGLRFDGEEENIHAEVEQIEGRDMSVNNITRNEAGGLVFNLSALSAFHIRNIRLSGPSVEASVKHLGIDIDTRESGYQYLSYDLDSFEIPLLLLAKANPVVMSALQNVKQETLVVNSKGKVEVDPDKGRIHFVNDVDAVGFGKIDLAIEMENTEFDLNKLTEDKAGFQIRNLTGILSHAGLRYEDGVLADLVIDTLSDGNRQAFAANAVQQARMVLRQQPDVAELFANALSAFLTGANFLGITAHTNELFSDKEMKRRIQDGTFIQYLNLKIEGG